MQKLVEHPVVGTLHTEKSSSLEWNTDVKLFCNETPCSSLLVNRLQIRFVTALRCVGGGIWYTTRYTSNKHVDQSEID